MVDVLGGALGDRRPRLARVRVERAEGAPVGGVDELAADVVLEPLEPFRVLMSSPPVLEGRRAAGPVDHVPDELRTCSVCSQMSCAGPRDVAVAAGLR